MIYNIALKLSGELKTKLIYRVFCLKITRLVPASGITGSDAAIFLLERAYSKA